ncbi:MAG: DUF1844 domain-containing protein [Phycisphaerales bacterium]
MPDDPKIIVDDDWKRQAKAEKAKLAEAEQAKAAAAASKAAAPGAAPGSPAGAPSPDPDDPANYKVDFNELLRLLGTQALMYMGQFPDPQTGKAIIALDAAKVHIDMLGVLEDKTKGNLTDEEQQSLEGLLGELRMVFVEISRGVAKAMQEGRIGPRGEIRGAGAAPGPAMPGQNPGASML